jgi:hypothetical protein
MGQRLRLKAGFAIPENWTKEEKALLLGLKKYGAMVADNSSSFFSISITPDDRWPANAFSDIASVGIGITNFEVIQTTGTNQGPRSPGAPVTHAGPDLTAPFGVPLQLQGAVQYTNAPPAILWKLYSGPGTVTFADPTQTNTTAMFSAPGVYTLELSADDGVHAVSYDAVVLTVTGSMSLFVARAGMAANLSWAGGSPPFVVEETPTLQSGAWSGVITTSLQNATVALTNKGGFFRILGQ